MWRARRNPDTKNPIEHEKRVPDGNEAVIAATGIAGRDTSSRGVSLGFRKYFVS